MQDFETALPTGSATHHMVDEGPRSPVRRLQQFLHGNPTTIPAFILLLSVILFSLLVGGHFFDPFNLSLVLQQVTIIAVIGIAQTLIVLTAGIDLSVGAIMVLSSVVMGRLAYQYHVPIYLTFPFGLVIGLACGWINGVLVTVFRLPPFIVTLGTWSVYFALNLWYSKGETIRESDIEQVAPFLHLTGHAINVFGGRLTIGSMLMIALYGLFWFILNWTAFGTHVYAVGDDPDAARLAGIRVKRVLLGVYAVAGLICAVAGWVLIGRTGAVSPQSGYTSNLDSITAVVIGGTSLFGGRGSIIGTVIGALIVGVFRNGLALYGVDVLWQEFTVGLLIIVAVALDQWIRQVSS
jgi:fructose transport system permease protein